MLADNPYFDNHERVLFINDQPTGLKAIIAIHSTVLGPAVGGIRMWPYDNEADALNDVLKLSRGMTLKTAIADLPLGGGKSVIIGDPNIHKTPQLLHAFGRALNDLGGSYIGGEDVGMTVADVVEIQSVSEYVAGSNQGKNASGDPSLQTALGVFLGIKAAVTMRFGQDGVAGLTVGVQGLGNVGMRLARQLHANGARLVVADLDGGRVEAAVKEFGAEVARPDAIHAADLDVFSPCAMGGILNAASITEMNAKVVAGSANNQLQDIADGGRLLEAGILYAPDYVINGGGVINIAGEALSNYDPASVDAKVRNIPRILNQIFDRSARRKPPPGEVADQMAMERLEPVAASA